MSVAINYAIKLLTRREHSELELRQKLAQRKFNCSEIANTLDYLKQHKLQSDLRFTEVYINHRARQGYAKYRIITELKQKGITDHIITEVLNNLIIDWSIIIQKLINKKLASKPATDKISLKTKQQLWRYLINHGFMPDDFINYLP